MYRLKHNQPPFEVVDGPMAGQKFAHGFVYSDLPAGEQERFEPIDPPEPLGKPGTELNSVPRDAEKDPEKTADQPTRKGGRKEEVADA